MQVGIAIGRTFIDMVCRADDAGAPIAKSPGSGGSPNRAVLFALDRVRDEWGVRTSAIRDADTETDAAAKTVPERKSAPISLITKEGFRDLLAIDRQMHSLASDAADGKQP
jgi:N-methylhydantoinase A/oxoprolinase/acetone carboxylase beta subunit